MKTYVEKLVGVIQNTELDLDPPYYTEGSEERNTFLCDERAFEYGAGQESVDIDYMIEYLKHLKDQGANRVRIAYHSDHRGYYVYGCELIEV